MTGPERSTCAEPGCGQPIISVPGGRSWIHEVYPYSMWCSTDPDNAGCAHPSSPVPPVPSTEETPNQ